MKILIVSQYYWPEQFQINEIAPELVKRGHEVTVLCGVPNYPKGVVFDGYCDRTRCYSGRRCCSIEVNASVLHLRWSASQVYQILLDNRPDTGA